MVRTSIHRGLLAAGWILVSLAVVRGVEVQSQAAAQHSEKPDRQFTVFVDGSRQIIVTHITTVGEAIAQAGIAVGSDDKIVPNPSSPVVNGLQARIIRISTKRVPVECQVPPTTIRRASDNLRRGASVVAVKGEAGLRRDIYDVTYADGKKIVKKLVGSETIRKMTPRVIAYGQGSSLPSRGFVSRKVMTMTATAYDPRNCGGSGGGRTAIGMQAGRGVVAVDPRVIKLGSRLYIEGYGFAVAGDTGGAIKGHRIDLGHNTYAAARRFGRKKVVVHVLN